MDNLVLPENLKYADVCKAVRRSSGGSRFREIYFDIMHTAKQDLREISIREMFQLKKYTTAIGKTTGYNSNYGYNPPFQNYAKICTLIEREITEMGSFLYPYIHYKSSPYPCICNPNIPIAEDVECTFNDWSQHSTSCPVSHYFTMIETYNIHTGCMEQEKSLVMVDKVTTQMKTFIRHQMFGDLISGMEYWMEVPYRIACNCYIKRKYVEYIKEMVAHKDYCHYLRPNVKLGNIPIWGNFSPNSDTVAYTLNSYSQDDIRKAIGLTWSKIQEEASIGNPF